MDSKVSVLLNGGIDTQSESEFASPIMAQGASPTLVTSANTRLSTQPGTCDRAPAITRQTTGLGAGEPCFGIVPEGRLRRSVMFATPHLGNRVLAEDGSSPDGTGVLRAVNAGENGQGLKQNVYWPSQLTDAGQIPGAQVTSNVAVCYNETLDQVWYAWTATTRDLDGLGLTQVCVCALNAAGMLLIPAYPIEAYKATPGDARKVGLTAHGDNGVSLWWSESVSDTICTMTLTVSGTQLSTGARLAVSTGQTQAWDVVAFDSTYAFLASGSQGTLAGTLNKVEVATGVMTTLSFPGAFSNDSGDTDIAVHYEQLPLGHRVAVVFEYSDNEDGDTLTYCVTDENLTPIFSPRTLDEVDTGSFLFTGLLAVKFLVTPDGWHHMVIAVGHHKDAWSQTSPGLTGELGHWVDFYTFYTETGTATSPSLTALNPVPRMHFYTLVNKGAQLQPTLPTEQKYPLFFLARDYGSRALSGPYPDSHLPGGEDYVVDPSVVGYLFAPTGDVTNQLMVSPVAHFGVVRGNQPPAYTSPTEFPAGGPCPSVAGEIVVAYREFTFGVSNLNPEDILTPREARFVKIGFGAEQPAAAIDKDGAALVAAALPVQWDGSEVVELGGPLYAPMLIVGTTAGGTAAMGVYQLSAIYQWTDAAGLKHRSAPSTVQTVTLSGTERIVAAVAMAGSMRNGLQQFPVEAVLYCTGPTGASFHLVNDLPTYEFNVATWELFNYDFTGNPTIYSNGAAGSEITPQPPPPLKDIVIVGSRAWGVDAEVPTRIVYSKLRVAGVGFEFFPAGELLIPSGAGEIVAIQEWAGTVTVFAEHAIYQIADGGPSNQIGGGGSFGSPYRVADVGCSERRSVLRTPVGIFFRQPNGVMAVFAGAVAPLPGVRIPTGIVGAYMLENGDEACFIAYNTALTAHQVYAFNYNLKRWTTWDLVSSGAQVTPGIAVPSALSRSNAMLYDTTSGYINRVVGAERHDSVNMSWETDWVVLDGDFQTRVLLREVVLNGKRLGAHSITIDIFTDYNSVTPSTTRTWADAVISPLATEGRYTVRATPQGQVTRAVKIRITEARSGSVDAFRPRSLTVVFAVDGLLNETSFLVGSRQ